MERFVIGAAIVMAVAIAAAATFGGTVSGKHGLSIDFSRESVAATGEPASLAPAVFAARRVKVEDAAAVLNIVAEARGDVEISVSNPGALPMPKIRMEGDRLVVDGGLRRLSRCGGPTGFAPTVSGIGSVAEADLPVITIKTPMAVDAAVSGAVKTSISPSDSADLSFSGCGPAKIGVVAGALDVSASGSGDSVIEGAGALDADLSGAGDLTVGPIQNGLKLDLAGSSTVQIAALRGPVEINIAGSGEAKVAEANTGDTEVSIAGSGTVEFVGNVGHLETDVAGSGEVIVTGTASDVTASVMGAGDVVVGAVTGKIDQSVMGSGRVRIGDKQTGR